MAIGKILSVALLYAACVVGANPVLADGRDIEALKAMRAGDMKRMTFHPEPRAPVEVSFATKEDETRTLADWQGKIVLVNFWATWCAPCRHEMPALDALQADLGGEDFEVVTIATGRNPVPMIEKFFAAEEIENLPILRDPKQHLARAMSILGLPITVVLDETGQEIARFRGDADWASEDAKTLLRAIVGKADS